MIVKEYHPPATSDRFQKAGDDAELQMAHYLKRAFGSDPSVHVFNNLRLEHEGEVAQIDHLIFHRAGFIIVESKSVTSSVRINERDEWARQWNGRWSGMPSPVLQARRQADLLRALLQTHKVDLRNKMLFGLKQGGFSGFLMDVVVAISDRGVIQYRGQLEDVKKADQVADHIRALMDSHNRAAKLLSNATHKGNVGVDLQPEEVVRIVSFLRNRHREKGEIINDPGTSLAPDLSQKTKSVSESPESTPSVPTMSPAPVPAENFQCAKCQSTDLEIKFGHSYYFHCRSCDGNSPIKLTCPECAGQMRTRKSGKQFFRECANCGTSTLYFTNPEFP